MKYKIMFNWEGHSYDFIDDEFDSVGDAIKHAMGLGYSAQFIIVQVVDWKNLVLRHLIK